jgi:hypothetical protein
MIKDLTELLSFEPYQSFMVRTEKEKTGKPWNVFPSPKKIG